MFKLKNVVGTKLKPTKLVKSTEFQTVVEVKSRQQS